MSFFFSFQLNKSKSCKDFHHALFNLLATHYGSSLQLLFVFFFIFFNVLLYLFCFGYNGPLHFFYLQTQIMWSLTTFIYIFYFLYTPIVRGPLLHFYFFFLTNSKHMVVSYHLYFFFFFSFLFSKQCSTTTPTSI